MAIESKCWTCSRAYALPDPEGCGFHRQEHEPVYDDAITGLTSPVGPYKYQMTTIKVTKCRHYDRQNRKVELTPSQKGWDTRRERDRLEGIG